MVYVNPRKKRELDMMKLTTKTDKAILEVAKQVKKGDPINQQKAMLKAGMSPGTARNGGLTKHKNYNKILDLYLDDESNARTIQKTQMALSRANVVFPMNISDKEVYDMMHYLYTSDSEGNITKERTNDTVNLIIHKDVFNLHGKQTGEQTIVYYYKPDYDTMMKGADTINKMRGRYVTNVAFKDLSDKEVDPEKRKIVLESIGKKQALFDTEKDGK